MNLSLCCFLPPQACLRLKRGSQRRYQHFSHSGVGCYDSHEVSTNRKTSPDELNFPLLHSPDKLEKHICHRVKGPGSQLVCDISAATFYS